jgi:mRNA-degrading endonuclease RelE of RelBE toxin-antitoxin system
LAERERPADRRIEQSTRFGKAKRRLHAKQQLTVDDQVKKLVEDPLAGEAKSGPLAGVRVVKFKVDKQQFLLAYEFNEKRNVIELLDIGAHENFYKDLRDYLDAR